MKALYETSVTSHGGRNGHIRSEDGILDLKVSTPKAMGGAGGATNPEQLFAAGYAACFENAILHVARQQKVSIKESEVIAKVAIGTNDSGGFQLAATLQVKLGGVDRAQAKALVDAAHQVCPYSNATRGNIDVKLEIIA